MAKNYTALKEHKFYDEDGYLRAVTVEYAAKHFDVSTRRVRQMLADGVLKGAKHSRAWRVDYPFVIRLGTRGPASQAFKDKSYVPKKRWKSKPFDNPKHKKGN